MSRALAGKVAIVTGAGSGIGAATAKAMTREGARVVCADVNAACAEAVVQGIALGGGSALAVEVDVARAEQVRRMVDACVGRFGTVDILACVAGVVRMGQVERITEEEWDFVVGVNLRGVFLCAQAVLPIMKEKRAGKIVIVGSMAGRMYSRFGGAHYSASKAGVLGFGRHLAHEVAPFGINVNAVNPAIVDTPMLYATTPPERLGQVIATIPFGRPGSPDDVANVVVFLASEEASYITGASIDVTGGNLIV